MWEPQIEGGDILKKKDRRVLKWLNESHDFHKVIQEDLICDQVQRSHKVITLWRACDMIALNAARSGGSNLPYRA